MVPAHKPSSKFGKWLLKYRLKLILFSFLVIIPIIFVVSLYLGDYLRNKNVIFDETKITNFKSTSLIQEDLTNHDVIQLHTDDVVIEIKLINYNYINYYDETDGKFVFKTRYYEKTNKTINNLKVDLVIQTDWINAKSIQQNIPTTKTFGSDKSISFNHVLPQKPLLFISVNHPNLYVKVSYNLSLPLDQVESKTHYFKTYLGDVTPTTITDLENK
ncbi:hypothetical protein [Acholeplasma granularum]|uniref:hypothetical protein n=1 Tax=Acholeplasma granularum TaxID=264635 RepID=UPI00047037C3|nr:hypothetical protein [Acholeplasma granularum]